MLCILWFSEAGNFADFGHDGMLTMTSRGVDQSALRDASAVFPSVFKITIMNGVILYNRTLFYL